MEPAAAGRPFAGHEHAGDVGHPARNAIGRFKGLQIESQVTAELPQKFRARALAHRLCHEIADPIRKQRVPPEHLHVSGLVREVRLISQHDGHQPIGILEGDQPTRARLVPAEVRVICSKNAGFFSVTVNDAQQDCAIQLLKAAGLPNSGR